jgi:hypothetical protein
MSNTQDPKPPTPAAPSDKRPKTLEEIAAAFGITDPLDLDAWAEKGPDRWESDEQMQEFLAAVRAWQRERGIIWPTGRPLKTVEEIMAEQGITGPQDLDTLIGAGADLWNSDEELDQFLADIRARRKEGG